MAYQTVYLCYRNLKSWDVFRTPQDDMLLKWDKWLFFGHSPAVLLHDLLGRDLAARFLTDWYEAFSTLVTIALVAALAFTPTGEVGVRLRGVGDVGLDPRRRLLLPDPRRSARSTPPRRSSPGLTRTSIQHTQETYVLQRTNLLAEPQVHGHFAQISAFASLHCALTFLIFLMARYYGLRVLSWAVAVFLVGHPGRHGLPRLALRGGRRRRARCSRGSRSSSENSPCWVRGVSAGTRRSRPRIRPRRTLPRTEGSE